MCQHHPIYSVYIQLLSPSVTSLQSMFSISDEELQSLNTFINPSKSACMRFEPLGKQACSCIITSDGMSLTKYKIAWVRVFCGRERGSFSRSPETYKRRSARLTRKHWLSELIMPEVSQAASMCVCMEANSDVPRFLVAASAALRNGWCIRATAKGVHDYNPVWGCEHCLNFARELGSRRPDAFRRPWYKLERWLCCHVCSANVGTCYLELYIIASFIWSFRWWRVKWFSFVAIHASHSRWPRDMVKDVPHKG